MFMSYYEQETKDFSTMTLYESIREDLLSKIKDGTYPEGQTIPSELELAEIYGVSRPTVRQALQLLADDGYLEKRRRRGTIVTSPKISQSFTMTITSFEDAMRLAGHMPRTNVLVFRCEDAGEDVASPLEISTDDPVYRLVRLRYADDIPNVFVESYVPRDLYPGLEEFDFNETSLYDAMGRCGSPVMSARRRLEAIRADGPSAALLDVDPGDPLLLFHTVARNAEGVPAEYSIASYRGASNSFEIDVRRA